MNEEVDRLRAALERYGEHDRNCANWREDNSFPCTCGYTAAMRGEPWSPEMGRALKRDLLRQVEQDMLRGGHADDAADPVVWDVVHLRAAP